MLADVGLIQVDEKNEKLMQFVENAQHPQKYPNIRLSQQSVPLALAVALALALALARQR